MDILNILKSRLPQGSAQIWCEDLLAGDEDCLRLAVCLAIELRRPNEEVLLLEHLEKIFENCDYEHQNFVEDQTKSYPRTWFDFKRREIKDAICKQTCIVPTSDPIEASVNNNIYVTTLDFYSLVTYYISRLKGYPTFNTNDREEVTTWIEEFPDFIDKLGFFGNVTKPSPVWVTTKDEIDRIKNLNPEYNEATNIFNCLGIWPRPEALKFYPNTGNLYFKVEYPLPSRIKAFQPSSLNRDWKDVKKDLFLSYVKKDSFGLTYAADASGQSAKEQIHEPLVNASGLRVFLIGELQRVEPNKSNIIEEGLKRLES